MSFYEECEGQREQDEVGTHFTLHRLHSVGIQWLRPKLETSALIAQKKPIEAALEMSADMLEVRSSRQRTAISLIFCVRFLASCQWNLDK
jgi:hypothetical protein